MNECTEGRDLRAGALPAQTSLLTSAPYHSIWITGLPCVSLATRPQKDSQLVPGSQSKEFRLEISLENGDSWIPRDMLEVLVAPSHD